MAEYEDLKLTTGDKEPILFMDAVHPETERWLDTQG